MDMNMKLVNLISFVLVIVGGLNWGAIGAFKTDFVSKYAGQYAHYVFIAVGVASVVLIAHHVMHTSEHTTNNLRVAAGRSGVMVNGIPKL
jgi:uncharacterized membrane protein YuzA (DUF378 family)